MTYDGLILFIPTLDTVSLAAPAWGDTVLPAASVDVAYSHDFTLTGGAIASVLVASGTLPAGLSAEVVSDHVIRVSGTPTALGTATFTLSASNTSGTATTGTLNIQVSVTTFTQSFGDELVTNSEFDAWTGSAADNFSLSGGTWGADPGVIQSAPGGGAGTGAARIVGTSTATATLTPDTAFSVGEWYQVRISFTAAAVAGYYALLNAATQLFFFLGAIRENRLLFKATAGTTFSLKVAAAPTDMALDYWRMALVSLMPVEDAPSGDGTFALTFELNEAETLTNHDQAVLWYRIQDESNYCAIRCMYLAVQSGWQVQAFVFVNNVSGAAKLTVNNIATRPDRIQVVVSGSDHTVQTVTGGVTATLGTFSSSSFSSEVGLRAVWTEGITPTRLAVD